jgi:hypothetical protein
MHPPLSLARRACRAGHVLCQDDGGEAVLLDLAGERYYGLNRVGTRVWQLLAQPTTLADIHRTLCAEFDAPAERIEQDLLALVERLHAAGLIDLE